MICRNCVGILVNLSHIESDIAALEKKARDAKGDIPLHALLEKVMRYYAQKAERKFH